MKIGTWPVKGTCDASACALARRLGWDLLHTAQSALARGHLARSDLVASCSSFSVSALLVQPPLPSTSLVSSWALVSPLLGPLPSVCALVRFLAWVLALLFRPPLPSFFCFGAAFASSSGSGSFCLLVLVLRLGAAFGLGAGSLTSGPGFCSEAGFGPTTSNNTCSASSREMLLSFITSSMFVHETSYPVGSTPDWAALFRALLAVVDDGVEGFGLARSAEGPSPLEILVCKSPSTADFAASFRTIGPRWTQQVREG